MAEQQNPPAREELKSSDTLRKRILFGLLAIALAAFAYDYGVARPAVNEAYDKLLEESKRVNAIANEVLTKAQVAELLGKEPARSFNDDNDDLVEVYSFAGGMPFKPHELYAVYKKQGDESVFYRHAKFAYDTSAQIAPALIPKEGTPEPYDYSVGDEYDSEMSEQDGGGPETDAGGESGPEGRGPSGGGNFDPEAMFSERDADGDGQLTGDEVSDRMKENLSEIDKDGDGAVSKEELMQRFEEMRARFGGGQRGPGDPDEGDSDERPPQRPPAEE